MKLDIEAMVSECFEEVDNDTFISCSDDHKKLAILIVERCAVEARKHIIHSGDADKAATAIRSLVVDK